MSEATAATDAPKPRLQPTAVIVGYDGRDASRDALVLADALATSRSDPLIAAYVSEALHPLRDATIAGASTT